MSVSAMDRRRAILSPRRRSILNRASLLPVSTDQNDDEAERAALLAEDKTRTSNFSTPSSGPRSIASEISSPQKEHFQGCLKLYAENKINKDNAWNLQLIDFMSTMLRKHDSRMENLQMASTTLDASARIYSFRVDAVHHDVLKMAGGLSKATQVKRGKKPNGEEEDNLNNSTGDDAASQKKKEKRKKSAKSSLATNIESQLNTEIEVNECIDPFFAQLAATTGDMTSSNRAFNASLPIDDENLGIILRSDLLFLDLKDVYNALLETESLELFDWKRIQVLPITTDDRICAPFHGFSIKDWDPDEEEEKKHNTSRWLNDNLNLSQQTMAFDMNADVEPLPQNDQTNVFFYDNDHHDAVESDEEEVRVMSQAQRRDKSKVIAHLVDMRPSAQSDGFLEYSYSNAVIGSWAGPSHWKLKNNINKGPRATEKNCQTITTVITKRAPSRKKRQLDYIGEGMVFNRQCHKCPEYDSVIPAKIMIGRKTLSQGTAWNEKNFKTPIDRGYNLVHFRKFYLQQTVMLSLASDVKPEKKNDISDVNEYDYNNDNDTSYCPNSQNDNDGGDIWANDECNKEGDIHSQNGNLGPEGIEMVEPPPKVAKIFIPYAMRAKKVDMKQLKHVTWRMLTPNSDVSENEKENINVQEIGFMDLYKKLPTRLSTNMKESLSVSLSLLAVLHLANENNLTLTNNSNYTDFVIKKIV